ncbi:MAG: exodeoxyribonuclease VII large subunit, partial [Planctomycetota bacterium]
RGHLPGIERRPVDVLIVGRGGGSLEDLWPFNEEIVARAIFASDIPVISAVGHEIDFTIADFVADLRALTPSEAGEKVVPRKDLLLGQLSSVRSSLAVALRNALVLQKERLDSIASSYAFRLPLERVHREEQDLDDLSTRMYSAGRMLVSAARERIAGVAGRLDNLSPLKVLARGYSVTSVARSDSPITDARSVSEGDEIDTRLHRGRVRSRVIDVEDS